MASTDYYSSSSEYEEESASEDEDLIYTGYVGVVADFINTSAAVLSFSIDGKNEFAALDRCRLYINGNLCSCVYNIKSYIELGDIVNFDAVKSSVGYGMDFRVVTGWMGKKPKGDFLVTPPDTEPTDKIMFSYEFIRAIPAPTKECEESNESSEDESSEDEDLYSGYVGVVTRFINYSAAELRFSIDGKYVFAALDVERLYINENLCSYHYHGNINSFIEIGEPVNFDAVQSSLGYGIDFRVVTGWIGKKPRGDCLVTPPDTEPTRQIMFPYDFTSALAESEASTDSCSSSSSEYGDDNESSEDGNSEDESFIYSGYVGVVTRFINTSAAELRCSIDGKKEFAALDRCRLYINGNLCSNKRKINSYIEIGESVNFDAVDLSVGYGINFRVVTGWIGKKPTGDQIVASENVPTHTIRFPPNFTSN